MLKQIRNRHLLMIDLLFLTLASYLSFVLRLEHWNLGQYWSSWAVLAMIALTITPASLYVLRCYARYWRYASVEELILLAIAVLPATVLAILLSLANQWLAPDFIAIPRSVPIIYWLIALLAIATPRMALRMLLPLLPVAPQSAVLRRRTLVVGAGNTGETLVRELRRNPRRESEVIGFIDDDLSKRGVHIHGVTVLGGYDDLPEIIHSYSVDQVIIAIANLSGKRIREITSLCERSGVQTRIVPGLHELLGGRFTLSQVRDVRIEDLLRREPIESNISEVRSLLQGRRVLVTGGGGSIGSELCRQVLSCEPAELIVLGHGENSIFEIYAELNDRRASIIAAGGTPCRIETVIADIRSRRRISAVLAEYRPEIVFHAAAHKHVPLMEQNPVEAVTNNILGTRNVIDAALAAGVQHFVMISTDKAVNPTSIMGTCKRVAELLVHDAAMKSGKSFVAVRFGNVLGSRGSVVLTFKKQIAAGGPVTVTHPEMIRYFMTIPEAVQLVLQAATLGSGGEVFTLDMGKPVKIIDMALDMIALSGLEAGRDIDVQFTGLRPGEKLYEELFLASEDYRRTRHQHIFIAANASSLVPDDLFERIEAIAAAAQRNDKVAIRCELKRLVPEFRQFDAPMTPANEASTDELLERSVGMALSRNHHGIAQDNHEPATQPKLPWLRLDAK